MSRPRTPTKTLELRGAFTNNPQRRRARAGEPIPNPELGAPPPHFDAAQRLAWGEIERISTPGVLAQSDRLIVEMAAALLATFRALGASLEAAKLARLESLLGRCGLSPSDRSRVAVIGPARVNKFADIG